MRLDPKVLADLAIDVAPSGYLRVTPLRFRATPLGMGLGRTRFCSPDDAFTILYIAEDLATGLAETKLAAGPVEDILTMAALVPALRGLDIEVVP